VGQLCEIDMDGTPTSVGSSRAFVQATLEAWKLDVLVDTAVLLTSELVTNVVLHARTRCRVSIALDGCVTIEVSDGSEAQPVTSQSDPVAERGRGLHVVSALADRWGTRPEDQGKTVWFALDLPIATT
jgi:anti-sigma regulatory factor (Ser/Thr protein kinase)